MSRRGTQRTDWVTWFANSTSAVPSLLKSASQLAVLPAIPGTVTPIGGAIPLLLTPVTVRVPDARSIVVMSAGMAPGVAATGAAIGGSSPPTHALSVFSEFEQAPVAWSQTPATWHESHATHV